MINFGIFIIFNFLNIFLIILIFNKFFVYFYSHGYLVVDFRQETDDTLGLSAKIFPSYKNLTQIYIK